MCNRFALHHDADELTERFKIDIIGDLIPARFNIAPLDNSIAIRAEKGKRIVEQGQWGLLSPSETDAPRPYRVTNARVETLLERSMFRDLLRDGRRLIPASGFYEWKELEGEKQPFYFSRRDGGPIAFAGLWQTSSPEEETPHAEFVIITGEPNALVANYHNRMPIILSLEAENIWLLGSTTDAIKQLVPFSEKLMQAWPVSRKVNSTRAAGSDCISAVQLFMTPSLFED